MKGVYSDIGYMCSKPILRSSNAPHLLSILDAEAETHDESTAWVKRNGDDDTIKCLSSFKFAHRHTPSAPVNCVSLAESVEHVRSTLSWVSITAKHHAPVESLGGQLPGL